MNPTMTKQPAVHPVYRSVNRLLTVGGAERRLFFLAMVMGGATFNFAGSAVAGVLMGLVLYLGARWVTARDPQFLRIVLRSATARHLYDPGKFAHASVRRRDTR